MAQQWMQLAVTGKGTSDDPRRPDFGALAASVSGFVVGLDAGTAMLTLVDAAAPVLTLLAAQAGASACKDAAAAKSAAITLGSPIAWAPAAVKLIAVSDGIAAATAVVAVSAEATL